MATDKNIDHLILNRLTKEQYEAIEEPNEDELYFVPDEEGELTPQALDELIDGTGDITVDLSEDEDALLIGTHAKTVTITGVPPTATSGTLTEEQLAALLESEKSVIKFNNEIYFLNDNGHETGILGYSHVGVENSVYMLKNITVTTSTRAWVLTVQEIDDFTGATSSAAGAAGLVPAPTTADAGKFLKGDGTWGEAGGVNVVQDVGLSTTDVMSQKAVASMIFDSQANNYQSIIKIGTYASVSRGYGSPQIALGKGATASGAYAIAIGTGDSGMPATASGTGSLAIIPSNAVCPGATGYGAISIGTNTGSTADKAIAFGYGSRATTQGEFSIGDSTRTDLYDGTGYRKITNVYDGENAHDAATYGQMNTRLGGLTLLSLTQAEYDALTTKDANTLYVIKAA